MKTILKVLVVNLLVLSSMNIIAKDVEAAANIPDANLKQCVKDHLSITTDPTVSDMNSSTGNFYCSNQGVVDLTGLDHLINVKDLHLNDNLISNINVVDWSLFDHIDDLRLDGNQISDVSNLNLSGLPSLKFLYLNNNLISDVSVLNLSSLNTLKALYLDNNLISDVGGLDLSDLNTLQTLTLNNNQISDVSDLDLSEADNLRYLYLSHNHISDIGVLDLSNINGLRDISLNNQTVTLPPIDVPSSLYQISEVVKNLDNLTVPYSSNPLTSFSVGETKVLTATWSENVVIGRLVAPFSGEIKQSVTRVAPITLSANNFTINLSDLNSLNETKAKADAAVNAMQNGIDITTSVSVDSTSLNHIKLTAARGVYPLTFNVTNLGVTESKTINVFVLGKDDKANGDLVIMANNYTMNLSDANTYSENNAITDSGVKVYGFDTAILLPTSNVSIDVNAINNMNEVGYQELDIEYMDGSGNIFTTVIANVVNNNTKVNSAIKEALHANGFTIDVSEVNGLTAATVLNKAKAKAWNMDEGSDVVVNVNYNNIVEALGSYQIEFTSVNGTTKTVMVNVINDTVVNGTNYMLSAEGFNVHIDDYGSIDILANSKAKVWKKSDNSVGTPQIITSTLTENVGVYSVELKVAEEATTTKTVYVTVYDDTTEVGNKLMIDATSFSVDLSNVGGITETSVKTDANVYAWDKLDSSDLTSLVTVSTGEFNTIKNTLTKGIFDLTFSVTKYGETLDKTVKVFVVDNDDVVNVTDDIVLMADDFEVDIDDAGSYSNGVVDSAAKAYKYSDGTELSVANISVDHTNINNATSVGTVNVVVTYDDGMVTETVTVAVSITSENTVISNGEAIDAVDFTLTIAEATALSDSDVVTKSSATAWDTGDSSPLSITVDRSAVLTTIGVYPVELSTPGGTVKTVYATVGDDLEIGSEVSLSADNFTIEIDDLGLLDEDEAKSRASAYAFDMDDSSDVSNKITVDTGELTVIQDTETKGVYDLTFSVTHESETIDKTVKVYVIDSDDVVNVADDIVLLADDFEVDIDDASSYSNGVVDSSAKAYKYSDGSMLSVVNISVDHTNINNATDLGPVDVVVTYSDGMITETITVVASITGSDTATNGKLAKNATSFSINLDVVNSITEALAKAEANVYAWDKINSSDLTSIVTVNTGEFTAIKNTLTKGIFDLTFSVTKYGETLDKTVKVFVVDSDDVISRSEDIVLMADDFEVHIDNASSYSDGMIDSGARAYKFSDGRSLLGNGISIDHTNINNATSVGPVNVAVEYDDNLIGVPVATSVVASIIGENTIINATDREAIDAVDFRLTTAEAGALTDNDVTTKSNVVAWNMNDGTFINSVIDRSAVIATTGIYPVLFNTAAGTEKTVYAIVGDDLKIGSEVSLTAKNFTIEIDDLGLLDDALAKSRTSAYAFDMNDNSDVSHKITVESSELSAIQNTTTKGIYDLTFNVIHENETLNKTVKVFVIDNDDVVNRWC